MGFSVRLDVHVEDLVDGYLVLVDGADHVHRLTGAEAEAFALARRGATRVPGHLTRAMAGLVEAGIVESSTWSRRKVLQLGGASAAAGIATLALPGIAAAASPGDPTAPPTTASTTTTTPPSPSPPRGLYISEFGNDEYPGWVKVWDGSTLTPVVTDVIGPTGLAWHGDVLYIASWMRSLHTWDGSEVTTIVPSGPQALSNPYGMTWHGGLLYVATNGSGSVGIWDGSTYDKYAFPLSVATDVAWHGTLLYISTLIGVYTWDGTSVANLGLTGLSSPNGLAWHDDAAYITNNENGTVSTWNPATNTTTHNVITGLSGPRGLLWHDDVLYIVNDENGTVSTWDSATDTTTHNVITGLTRPQRLAWY